MPPEVHAIPEAPEVLPGVQGTHHYGAGTVRWQGMVTGITAAQDA
jgi:hypothetical protein